MLSTDQRVAPRGEQHYVYTDASLVCGALELMEGTTDVLENPSVVKLSSGPIIDIDAVYSGVLELEAE